MHVLMLAVVILLQASPYRAEVERYRRQRAAEIGAETGWIALTDLHWLDRPGEFTIGRAAANAIVLAAPSAPPRLGTLSVTADGVTLQLTPEAAARTSLPRGVARRLELLPDRPIAEALTIGGMRLALIERASRRAIRVWDAQSPARRTFQGLRWMPIDEAWKIDARFVRHAPVPVLKIQNIVGQVVEMKNPGTAVFRIGGREYRLEALLESDDAGELFFMFRDGTSGRTTYGAGRYLYAPLPKAGRVTIDFNRAINPPCAFTSHATCPLPPASNRLTVAIEAGELSYQH